MREHMGLYKGKRLDNGEWVEGWLVKPLDGTVLICTIVEALGCGYCCQVIGDFGNYHVDPDTVGECTSLKDKNGKLIFEGDILLVKTIRESIAKETRNDEYTAYGVVVFNNGHFELEGKGLVLCTYWGLKALYTAASFKEYEIIGNIHDNPELLKGGEDNG